MDPAVSHCASEKNAVLLFIKSAGNRKVISNVLAEYYSDILTAADTTSLERHLARASDIRIALVDVAGFGASVWESCKMLGVAGIPFVVLSPPQLMASSSTAVGLGALSLLQKPISKAVLLELIKQPQSATVRFQ